MVFNVDHQWRHVVLLWGYRQLDLEFGSSFKLSTHSFQFRKKSFSWGEEKGGSGCAHRGEWCPLLARLHGEQNHLGNGSHWVEE